MLLISKFKDYYDSATVHGIDKTVVYSRTTEVITRKSFGYPTSDNGAGIYVPRKDAWCSFWIGFCGKWYLGKAEERYSDDLLPSDYRWNTTGVDKTKTVYGQDVVDFLEGRKSIWWFKHAPQKERDLLGKENLAPFLELDCPVIAIVDGVTIKNPVLSNFAFAKIKSPTEAFQEIEMFLTNELARQVDPAPLSDKDRIKAHGFDKWSFRRDTPPKRKQK